MLITKFYYAFTSNDQFSINIIYFIQRSFRGILLQIVDLNVNIDLYKPIEYFISYFIITILRKYTLQVKIFMKIINFHNLSNTIFLKIFNISL